MSEFDDLGTKENMELLRDLESLTMRTQISVLRDAVADAFAGQHLFLEAKRKEYLNAQVDHRIDEILQNGPAYGYASIRIKTRQLTKAAQGIGRTFPQ